MPEAPEVRTIVDQLDVVLKGQRIDAIEILSGRYRKHGAPVGLEGLKFPLHVKGVDCKGKFIWFEIAGDRFIWNTLGMTGYWSKKQEQHARLRFKTSVGDIFFCDVRNFGTIHFDRTKDQHDRKIASLGIDLLKGPVDASIFKQRLMKGKDKTIVETLMDQSITAGVGNYIVAEALWASEISPRRSTRSLSDFEFKRLQETLVAIMTLAYQSKGMSMSDYRDIDGNNGAFKFELKCYGRKFDSDGKNVIKEKRKDGRMTHWVPERQK